MTRADAGATGLSQLQPSVGGTHNVRAVGDHGQLKPVSIAWFSKMSTRILPPSVSSSVAHTAQTHSQCPAPDKPRRICGLTLNPAVAPTTQVVLMGSGVQDGIALGDPSVK